MARNCQYPRKRLSRFYKILVEKPSGFIFFIFVEKIKTAFVLGAGLGTRLKPLTDSLPKPLLTIKGRAIIEIIFDALINLGVEHFIVNTHHLPQKYLEHFPNSSYKGRQIKFMHEEILLDTGGGIKNIIPLIGTKDPLLVYNGDILFGANLNSFVKKSLDTPSAASLCLRSFGDNMNVSVSASKVVDLRFALGAGFERKAQFTGVFIAKEKFLLACKNFPQGKFSSVDIFLDLLKKDAESLDAIFEDSSSWSDIGTMQEYERVR